VKTAPTRLEVALGARSYPILVHPGGFEGLGAAVGEALGPRRVVLVSNPTVERLHGAAARASLAAAGIAVDAVEVPDGEAEKTVESWARLVDALLELRVDRRTPLLALGGGVTGDLVGFAAATVLRGVPLVAVPTTLLAMVDSAVGGKTGVNARQGKNLVGAFHQPSLVYAAIASLSTLPPAELRCGLGEVVKHGILGDPSLFTLCEERAADVLAGDPALMVDLVVRNCRVKAAVVAADEREEGLRAVLNLGHTVGHAFETALGHGALRHGECVALGLVGEVAWAARGGRCSPQLPARLVRTLQGLGLPVQPPSLDPALVLAAAGVDKKVAHGTLATAVVRDVGHVELERIPLSRLAELFAVFPGFSEA
jgi:3-dehydroquinate synthase